MADPKQYHYRLQDPYEYVDADGLTNLSLLAVDIKDLYPTGWLLKHTSTISCFRKSIFRSSIFCYKC